MSKLVSLDEARSRLSGLVDRAAAGEEIVIARDGVPQAKLVPVAAPSHPRQPANAMQVGYIAPDFDTADPDINRLFGDDGIA